MSPAEICATSLHERFGIPVDVATLKHMLRSAYLDGKVDGMVQMQEIYSPAGDDEESIGQLPTLAFLTQGKEIEKP